MKPNPFWKESSSTVTEALCIRVDAFICVLNVLISNALCFVNNARIDVVLDMNLESFVIAVDRHHRHTLYSHCGSKFPNSAATLYFAVSHYRYDCMGRLRNSCNLTCTWYSMRRIFDPNCVSNVN
jgi:hypothetical protein